MSKSNPIRSQSAEQYFIDGRSLDSRAVQQITQNWIDFHMKTREGEFTKQAECSIFCGTWNVNAKKQEGSLHEWLLPTPARADIYAVGFQEIVDLNAMNVALNSNNTQQRAQFWSDAINDCLNSPTQSGYTYEKVEEKFMVGLYLVIFVKKAMAAQIRDVRSSSLGVGIMGMLGNKGGVLIRFSFFDSTLCFVCAHLAAHRENVAGRNSDFRNIYDRSVFDSESTALQRDGAEDIAESGGGGGGDFGCNLNDIVMPRQGAARYFDKQVGVEEHDIVFWLGDLNYRIDDSISTEDVFQLIAQNNLDALRVKDQLNLERAGGRVFQGFQEGELHFAPTYKYQPGTDDYEQRPEKKLRAPAWCDRVLWRLAAAQPSSAASSSAVQKNNFKEIVTLVDYRRSSLIPSDHKPVSAYFQCAVKQVVERQETGVFKELLSTLHKYSSDALPCVEVSGLKVNFDKVLFDVPKTSTIEIRNVGQSVAHWRFVPKLEERAVGKKWLSIDRLSGLLLPGESVQVALRILVDRKTAHQLNAGKDTLQDALVLRVERSLDQFADIKADFQRSCFGMSLEELVQLTQPVCEVPYPAVSPEYFLPNGVERGPGKISSGNEPTALSIPKELWRIVDALWSSNSLKEKDLFNTTYAVPDEVAMIRQALDCGTEIGSCCPQSLVEVLLSFLSSLPRPLLPADLYPQTRLDGTSVRSFCRKFLEDLPPINYNVFVYLLSFFREVLDQDSFNRTSVEQLSAICVEKMSSAIFMYDEEYLSQSNDEKVRRETMQGYLQDVIVFLLNAPNL